MLLKLQSFLAAGTVDETGLSPLSLARAREERDVYKKKEG